MQVHDVVSKTFLIDIYAFDKSRFSVRHKLWISNLQRAQIYSLETTNVMNVPKQMFGMS